MKRIAPIVVLIAVAAIGTGMTLFANAAANRAAQSQFDLITSEATDRLDRRVSQQIMMLRSVAAHLETTGEPLSRAAFSRFINALGVVESFKGIRGIGFALLVNTDREAEVAQLISSYYGGDRPVWPKATDQSHRTPIALVEPLDGRNSAALGYDMYSEPVRRVAMQLAMVNGLAAATAPVRLVQEITEEKQNGFLVYMPVRLKTSPPLVDTRQMQISGFVFSPFRAGDLHEAAWASQKMPAVFQTIDLDSGGVVLDQSPDFASASLKGGFKADHEINVAGRKWQIHFVSNSAFAGANWQIGTLLLGIVSFLFAAALATSTRAQLQSVETANRLAALSNQAAEDKDMMLQEMKHRIKNSIARVLAIARQTASGSKSMDDFTASFFSRLQSMSAAQELLTRSHWEKANLRELLNGELHQVLGECWDQKRLSGEDIELNARATQALGLTFHELATNALKYGDQKGISTGLKVTWGFEKVDANEVLKLEWIEPGSSHKAGEKTGFGSKLIAMNIERELNGKLEYITDQRGLTIRITLPKQALL